MAYREVYFRIRTECYSSGWLNDADRAAFKEDIRRLCNRDRHNKIGNQFVAELMDELLQKGWLVTAKTSHGDGIRTATDKERGISRQPAAQVDGQIAIQSQENDAPKKKKGRKLPASRLFTLVLMLALSLNRWWLW